MWGARGGQKNANHLGRDANNTDRGGIRLHHVKEAVEKVLLRVLGEPVKLLQNEDQGDSLPASLLDQPEQKSQAISVGTL